MAERASWSGYLKLSLVSCAISLFPATTAAERIRFHIVNRKTGNRVKRMFVDSETGKEVDTDEQVKGFEAGKGDYLLIEDEEIEDIRIESTHTIDITQFVPREDINSRFLDNPYYMAPDDKVAAEAFAVIREAMEREGKAGIGRLVMARRERMIMMEPLGKGILATTLRYPYEMREAEDYFDDIPAIRTNSEMLDLASHIIAKKAGSFRPEEFTDRYEEALEELVKSKQNGKPPKTPAAAPKPSNVINLMDALRKSIGADKQSESKTAARASRPTRKTKTKASAKPARKAAAKRTASKKRAAG